MADWRAEGKHFLTYAEVAMSLLFMAIYIVQPTANTPTPLWGELVAYALGFAIAFALMAVDGIYIDFIEPYLARRAESPPPSDEEKRATTVLSLSIVVLAAVAMVLFMGTLHPSQWRELFTVGCIVMAAVGFCGYTVSAWHILKHAHPSRVDAITGFVWFCVGGGLLFVVPDMLPLTGELVLASALFMGLGYLFALGGAANILLNVSLALTHRGEIDGL